MDPNRKKTRDWFLPFRLLQALLTLREAWATLTVSSAFGAIAVGVLAYLQAVPWAIAVTCMVLSACGIWWLADRFLNHGIWYLRKYLSQASYVLEFRGELATAEWNCKPEDRPDCEGCEGIGEYRTAVRVTPKEKTKYHVDHNCHPQPLSGIRYVEFIGRFTTESHPYVRLCLTAPDGQRVPSVWFRIRAGAQLPVKSFPTEWEVAVVPEQLTDGWEIWRIDLEDACTKTFGRDGFHLHTVDGFRLRGSMTIAAIAAFK